ncbi:MAG: hypothetical protein LBT43_19430 [Prevotella sp.]|jgi:hypothetical protein|nr:hypothetical protein [Prevotella sp.]
MIYKASVSENGNIEVENYIPENQRPQSFIVNPNGIYVINPNDASNCKLKLPNGRIYSLQHFAIPAGYETNIFIGFNGNFYVAYTLNNKLQIIELVENNGELSSKEIAKTDISINSHIQFVQNHVKGTHVILIDDNILLEFDEGTGHINEHAYSTNIGSVFPSYYVSSQSLYVGGATSLAKIDLNTYELGILDFFGNGYEVNKISTSKNSPDMSFSGLRYSDGKNIIGVVDKNGVFTVNENTKETTEITNLIRLN